MTEKDLSTILQIAALSLFGGILVCVLCTAIFSKETPAPEMCASPSTTCECQDLQSGQY